MPRTREQEILDGRKFVGNLRLKHQGFYGQNLTRAELTQKHIALKKDEAGIERFGFADLLDFYKQSEEADVKAGVAKESMWR